MNKLIEKIKEKEGNTLVSDVVEVIPELNNVYECIGKIAKLSNDYKLNCAWKCLANGINVEKSINELYNYVNDSERAFFISNEFRKIILSSSVLSSSVIAFIVGKIVKENRKCTHKEAIILNAIRNMTDYDLKNFKIMMEKSIDKLVDHEIIEISKLDKENIDSYKYTLHVCTNGGVFLLEKGLMGEADENEYLSLYEGSHYLVTEIAYTLMEYLEAVRQLLNYGE